MSKIGKKIGDFRHRITFQEEVKTPDGYKGHASQWKDMVTVWGSIEPISGREYFYAQQITAEVTHRINVRYRTDITTKMRAKFEERIFELTAIFDLKERREFLEILATETK